jgi:hypothetical protein
MSPSPGYRPPAASARELIRWRGKGGMREDEALLQAMLASPEDATLRLMYADWLEE